jgi:ATP-binding cassette, subfamily B, bacterial
MTPSGWDGLQRLRTATGLIWAAHPMAALSVLGSTLVMGLLPVGTALITKLLLDRLAKPGHPSAGAGIAVAIVSGLAATALAQQLSQDGMRYIEGQLARRVEYIVQDRLFAKINGFPGLAWFEQPRFHDQMRLAQEAGQSTARRLIVVASGILQQSVTMSGFLIALIVLSPAVAVLTLAAAVPKLIAELRLARRRVALFMDLSPAERRKVFYGSLQAEPQAAKELRLFGLGAFFHGRMLAELREIQHREQTMDRRVLAVQSALGALSAVVGMVALWLVVNSAFQGTLTVGDVTVFLAALAGVSSGALAIVGQIAEGGQALGMIGYYEELMSGGPDCRLSAPSGGAPPLREGIVFEDVWFRYAEDLPWVLCGVTLRLPAGCSVALVGPNGAGKSTVVKLVCRLYEPSRGRIRWDGIDLQEIEHASLRRRIGAVFQDYMAYDLTAAENIGVGDLDHLGDLARIRRAADLAGAAPAIEGLPRGYDTMLSRIHFVGGEEDEQTGVLLSGGQWQRLALARMLMRVDRDLLILDEPSAGLDAMAEHQVQRMVHEETAGRTRLLISHRLNAVRMADQILVLHGGRIVESGTHDQLMRADGRYAELFTMQASGYQEKTLHNTPIRLGE